MAALEPIEHPIKYSFLEGLLEMVPPTSPPTTELSLFKSKLGDIIGRENCAIGNTSRRSQPSLICFQWHNFLFQSFLHNSDLNNEF
jgi:hypothetical protein